MKRVLVIGGTYFVGKSFLSNIIDKYNNEDACKDSNLTDEDTGEYPADDSEARQSVQSAQTKRIAQQEKSAQPVLELTVLNRGTRSLSYVLGAQYVQALETGRVRFRELYCDRTDAKAVRKAIQEVNAASCDNEPGAASHDDEPGSASYDAVVDFCAYNPGDIANVFNALDTPPKQYMFLSTCDVYERGTGKVADESAPFESRRFPGEAGAYISGKVALEGELEKLCQKAGTAKTVFRPSVIFGEGNYAPREGMYFKWISEAGQILHPADATGSFQLTYVDDVAGALIGCLLNETAYGKAYNLIGTKPLTYDDLADILERATGRRIERIMMTADEINARGIPLPFPLFAEESEVYTGGLIKETGFDYTEVIKAMRRTWETWLGQQAAVSDKSKS